MSDEEYGHVSEELDELAMTLIADALDLLAEGEDVCVLVATQDARGHVESFSIIDDGPLALLSAAHDGVRQAKGAVRYAICYEGAIEVDDGSYADALIVEFGERGHRSFSAYSLIEGKGLGDGLTYTDLAPAGEVEALLG